MSSLSIESKKIKIADLGDPSTVPAVFKTKNVQQLTKNYLDEDDGVYVGYGFIDDVFPYKKQCMYGRELKEKQMMSVALENEYLKAVFLPELGGRLWSLYDKKQKRDLLLTNNSVTFCNLALCDAWFCGGVEWNFGLIGHSVYTCSPLHTAVLKTDDGTPVIRFYEYERIRGCVYQVDAWLPDNSENLFVGVRLYNPNQQVVPTYWWSNIAVEEFEGGRIIVPANEAYINSSEDGAVRKIKSFISDGVDITYPTQNKNAIDHFWRTKNAENKYICALDADGYGICQASTSVQKGRKLFVWGQNRGSNNWQKFLRTDGNNGHYIEIQAGIGQTQYECVPMPPGAVFEWVESYGAIKIDKDIAHGEYSAAQKTANEYVSNLELENILKNATHLKRKADKVILRGSGWGALECECKKSEFGYPMPEHLDFGETGYEQQPWLSLLKNGTIGNYDSDKASVSWICGNRFKQLLEKAILNKDSKNWYAYLQLGTIALSENDSVSAEKNLKKSLKYAKNAWTFYVMACFEYKYGTPKTSADFVIKSLNSNNSDISLIRENLRILNELECYGEIIKQIKKLPFEAAHDGRVLLYLISAYVNTGKAEEAKEVFDLYGDTVITNIREGELLLTYSWIKMKKLLDKAEGKESDAEPLVPDKFEFRMTM